jgi:hypothetical protein
MSEHLHGRNTKLYFDEDGAATYTEVGDVAEVDAPSLERGRMPNTVLSDTHINPRPGWLSLGDMTFKLKLHKTQYDVLRGYAANGTVLYWRVQMPQLSTEATAGGKWEFQGFIASFKTLENVAVESDEPLMCTFVIAPTTIPTWTAGS